MYGGSTQQSLQNDKINSFVQMAFQKKWFYRLDTLMAHLDDFLDFYVKDVACESARHEY